MDNTTVYLCIHQFQDVCVFTFLDIVNNAMNTVQVCVCV